LELLLIRHGEAISNVGGRIAAPTDPLTLLGARQARALALRLAAEGWQPQKLVSSPLTRARQTTEVIAECLRLPSFEVRDDLAEMDVGPWAGKLWDDFLQQNPHLDPDGPAGFSMNWGYPGGETLVQVRERGLRALRELASLAEADDRPVIAVSHGTLLNQALCALLGVPPSPQTVFSWHNAALASLLVADGCLPKLTRLNDLHHLDDLREA
jgi:broad specificity phosphatase PhoE